jgi:hypothetical protein
VLCVDEKSQVQALDRTQPLLPMRPGQAERRSHDYTRHGTTSLFAALDVKAGTVVGKCMPRHRTQEFRKFLDEVEPYIFMAGLDPAISSCAGASGDRRRLLRTLGASRSRSPAGNQTIHHGHLMR